MTVILLPVVIDTVDKLLVPCIELLPFICCEDLLDFFSCKGSILLDLAAHFRCEVCLEADIARVLLILSPWVDDLLALEQQKEQLFLVKHRA